MALHIPESLGSESGGQLSVRDRGNGLKTQPVVYRWTSGAGWVNPTSYEVMRMKAVNHKPMIRPKGTLALQDGEEVSFSTSWKGRGLSFISSPLGDLCDYKERG